MSADHITWILWGDEPLGGVRRALGNFAAGLAARGWQVSMVCLDEGELATMLRAEGYAVRCLHDEGGHHARYADLASQRLGRLRALLRLQGYRAALQAALAALQPTVVSLYWADFLPLCGSVCRQLGIPLVWEMPEVPSVHRFRLNQRVYAALLAHYRVRPIANSRFTAERLGPVPTLSVVYPPSDGAHFDPDRLPPPVRATWALPPDSLLLGSIARLSPQKSGEGLIRGFALVQAEAPHLHLVFVGGPLESDYANRLRQMVAALGLGERIHFLGSVEDPLAAYRQLDLFVSCRPDPEGFGLSIVEAMLMRVPALVRALGGPAETVVDGVTGWHFHDDQPQTIAAAIRRALAARAQWPAMGAAARRRALAEFSLQASIPCYEQALRASLAAA